MMKIIDLFKQIFHTKIGNLALLLFVWAAVGFVFGMVLGRMIWMLQLI